MFNIFYAKYQEIQQYCIIKGYFWVSQKRKVILYKHCCKQNQYKVLKRIRQGFFIVIK
jgi:hypothetical protein